MVFKSFVVDGLLVWLCFSVLLGSRWLWNGLCMVLSSECALRII
jgi:hypothetical protein